MKHTIQYLTLAVMVMLSVCSCKKDKETSQVFFDREAVCMHLGESVEIHYTFTAVLPSTVSLSTAPEGWKVDINHATQSFTITAPSSLAPTSEGKEIATEGKVTLLARPKKDGISTTSSVFVALEGHGVTLKDISSQNANCMMIHDKKCFYSFNAMRAADGSAINTDKVKIVWQSQSTLIQYLIFENGKVTFYLDVDANDSSLLKSGNALLAAYDAEGELLTTWHIWATDYDPDAAGGTVTLNGYEMMTRNLGARGESNASQADIVEAYGLFYQWGRHTPFMNPSTFNCANGTSAAMYNGKRENVYMTMEESTATTGTAAYAKANPMVYLTTTQKDADWLQESNANRWSATSKQANDPCPAGWRVAPAAAFANLQIVEPLDPAKTEEYRNRYSWTLTDGAHSSLFFAPGRRAYIDGRIQNYYDESLSRAMEMQPWVGYYWTADSDGSQARAMRAWFRLDDVTGSGVNIRTMGRANGMQVRCVRAN